MYNTSATDLERVANDLNQVAKKYTDGSQQLDQHVSALDGATAQLLAGGSEQWKGVSSDAFHTAYLQRRSRMQQASMLLSQSAQHIAQFAQTIEEHLPAIRADQAVMQGPAHHLLGPDDQSSIMNEMSQAQNAIITALATLNSQLEGLAQEVRDCPEERRGNDQYNSGNISKSERNAGGEKNNGGGADNNGDFEEPKPVGSLKRVDDNWLKRQGLDAHDLKDGLEGGASRYDIFKDRDNNLFALRKGAPQSSAIWLGNLADL